MGLYVGNERVDKNLVVILSTVGQLLVTLGDRLDLLGQTLAQEDVNDSQIRGFLQEQQELEKHLNFLEHKLMDLMEQQIKFLQRKIDKLSIN
jgi:hypothetical protein